MVKILFVDDDLAKDAIEADTLLDKASHGSIELLLIDLSIPYCDGEDIAVACNTDRRSSQPNMRVVLYSARSEDELQKITKKVNAYGYIVKGKEDDLPGKIRKYLEPADSHIVK